MVRHFKETIPIQTTAMDEVSTILGGADNLEEAHSQPEEAHQSEADRRLLDGTGRDARRGLRGRSRHHQDAAAPRNWRAPRSCCVNTPDFDGALEEGWSKAVTAMIDDAGGAPGESRSAIVPNRVNILPGVHLTVGRHRTAPRACRSASASSRSSCPTSPAASTAPSPTAGCRRATAARRWRRSREMGRSGLHHRHRRTHARARATCCRRVATYPSWCSTRSRGLKPVDRLIDAVRRTCPAARFRRSIRRRRNRAHRCHARRPLPFRRQAHRHRRRAGSSLCAVERSSPRLGAEIVAAVTTTGTRHPGNGARTADVMVGDLGDFEDHRGRARGRPARHP